MRRLKSHILGSRIPGLLLVKLVKLENELPQVALSWRRSNYLVFRLQAWGAAKLVLHTRASTLERRSSELVP